MKCLDLDPQRQRGSESMTQTVLTAGSPDSRQPAYTDRQQTAGHPGPGGGGVAGACPGLLTWRGGAVTRPNIEDQLQPSHQLGAEETGQKLTYTREELARLATAAATAGNCPIYRGVFGSFSIHSKCKILQITKGCRCPISP